MCRRIKKQSEIPAEDVKKPVISIEDKEIDFFMHMHQLDRNELIARIQQRDQYVICFIGAFIAFLVGWIQAQSNSNSFYISKGLLHGCFVVFLLMVMLTCRLLNSYSIHKTLIKHTQAIEVLFGNTLPVPFWQTYIDTKKPKHRKYSFAITVIVILIADIFAFIVLLDRIATYMGGTTLLNMLRF